MVPDWLHVLSIASLVVGAAGAVAVTIDEIKYPQHMWIMNVVWPITALFASVLGIAGYFLVGRNRPGAKDKKDGAQTPFAIAVGKGTTHCGAGCTLGDITAEWLCVAFPAIAVGLGWGSLFPIKMFAVWVLDFVFAFGFGVAFQYFTIKPMRNLSVGQGLIAALKADSLSLTCWQIGMYGFMAFAYFYLFGDLMGTKLEVTSVEFWFMMQLAMLTGFVTAYPANWWLTSRGIKERM